MRRGEAARASSDAHGRAMRSLVFSGSSSIALVDAFVSQ